MGLVAIDRKDRTTSFQVGMRGSVGLFFLLPPEFETSETDLAGRACLLHGITGEGNWALATAFADPSIQCSSTPYTKKWR
jgi:hypothetical protein